MVSIRINHYQYREEVRQAILHHKASLDSEWDPFIAAWLVYALNQDGFENNPPLSELIGVLDRWSQEPETRKSERHLGSLALLEYFQRKEHRENDEIIEFISKCIESIDLERAYSPLRDPEQVFLIALCFASLRQESKAKGILGYIAKDQMKGPFKRCILYAATLRELGESIDIDCPVNIIDAGDIIAMIWWSEKYTSSSSRNNYWQTFINIKDNLVLSGEATNEDQRVLSASELAMLYEALAFETSNPDPNILFEGYPLHPRVKDISFQLYMEGNYFHAVLEAAKVLEEKLRDLAPSEDKGQTGRPLAQKLIGGKAPKIRFSKLQTRSEWDEQEGLRLLAEGIFTAFRNPKGHEPKDTYWGDLNPYEALDQLITISYLMKRIEDAIIMQ